jgi:hypothetical protein
VSFLKLRPDEQAAVSPRVHATIVSAAFTPIPIEKAVEASEVTARGGENALCLLRPTDRIDRKG